MKLNSNILLVIFTALCLADCNNVSHKANGQPTINTKIIAQKMADKTITYQDLIEAVSIYEPVLHKTKTIDDFAFDATYQPHLLLTLMNNDSIKPENPVNKADLKKISNYNNLHYIKFSMENKKFKSELLRYDIESADEYSERISYYSFYCNKDAYMVENNTDTIKGSFVNFERTFDVSPKLNFTFVFESKNKKPLQTVNFIFNDIIFNNGKLNFEFDYEKISTLNNSEIKKLIL